MGKVDQKAVDHALAELQAEGVEIDRSILQKAAEKYFAKPLGKRISPLPKDESQKKEKSPLKGSFPKSIS